MSARGRKLARFVVAIVVSLGLAAAPLGASDGPWTDDAAVAVREALDRGRIDVAAELLRERAVMDTRDLERTDPRYVDALVRRLPETVTWREGVVENEYERLLADLAGHVASSSELDPELLEILTSFYFRRRHTDIAEAVVGAGCVDCLPYILRRGSQISPKDLLAYAIWNDQRDMEAAIVASYDIDWSGLGHVALHASRADVARWVLLAEGAAATPDELEQKLDSGEALADAIRAVEYPVTGGQGPGGVELVLLAGAEIDQSFDGETPTMVAARRGRIDLVEWLKRQGVADSDDVTVAEILWDNVDFVREEKELPGFLYPIGWRIPEDAMRYGSCCSGMRLRFEMEPERSYWGHLVEPDRVDAEKREVTITGVLGCRRTRVKVSHPPVLATEARVLARRLFDSVEVPGCFESVAEPEPVAERAAVKKGPTTQRWLRALALVAVGGLLYGFLLWLDRRRAGQRASGMATTSEPRPVVITLVSIFLALQGAVGLAWSTYLTIRFNGPARPHVERFLEVGTDLPAQLALLLMGAAGIAQLLCAWWLWTGYEQGRRIYVRFLGSVLTVSWLASGPESAASLTVASLLYVLVWYLLTRDSASAWLTKDHPADDAAPAE